MSEREESVKGSRGEEGQGERERELQIARESVGEVSQKERD